MATNTNIRFHRITATSGSDRNTETNYVKGDVYFIKSATGNTGKVYICTVAGQGSAATLEDYSVDTNTWRPITNNLSSTSTTSSLSAAMGKTLNESITALSNSLAQKQDIISDIDTIRNNAANYKGTVTSIKVNGSSKTPSSGVVNIGNVATSVKVDNISKTPSGGAVDLGYVNKQLITSTSSAMTLSPNIYYRNTSTSLSTLTISLGSIANSNIINEYFIEFTTSSSGTTISLPSTIKWANGEVPTFEASTTYQISIVNNLGIVITFK